MSSATAGPSEARPRLKRDRSSSEASFSASFSQPVRRPLAKMRHLDEFDDDEETGGEASESQSAKDPYPDAVGSLIYEVANEEPLRIVVTLQEIVVIGRHHDCVRTNSQFTMVALSDLSTYGFILNGVFHRPDRVAKIDEKRLLCKTYILKAGDQIQLHEVPGVFTWSQGQAHSVELLAHPNSSPPIFTTTEAAMYPLREKWTVHNCPIGSGTFGTVNMASHRKASWLQVACKTVAKPTTPEDIKALQDEIDILKRMDHPNLNGILDRVSEDAPAPRVHLILELMTGGDLFAYSEKHGGLEEPEVKWIASQLVDGLGYLHNLKIAHRDLKPENILLAVSAIYPRVVIADFGHAISYETILDSVPETEFTKVARQFPRVGTASYIPPERLKAWCRGGQGLSGYAEDVHSSRNGGPTRREKIARQWFNDELLLDSWALGVTLYTTAFSEHPYDCVKMEAATPVARTFTEDKGKGRKVSGAVSWASFRQQEGEGRSIGTSRRASFNTARYQELYSHCKRDAPQKWFISRWGFVSDECISSMQGLLHTRSDKRLQVLGCSSHEWLKGDRRFLDTLYDRVIEHGEVLHFDRVEQLLADMEHDAGVQSSLPPSQEESPSSRWMTEAESRRSPIQPFDRPSPIPEQEEEDIEVDETGIEVDETADGEVGDTIVDDTMSDDSYDGGDDTFHPETGTV